MDVQDLDRQYAQVQEQSRQTIGEISTLADKLRAAAQSGNQDAREWMLDLKEIALAIQAEQNQIAALLQALHAFLVSQAAPVAPPPQAQSSPWTGSPPAPAWGAQPQPPPGYTPHAYPQQQPPGDLGGMVGNFMNSGFGRAITMGAGFGIGDDLITSLFRGFGGRRGC
ncbi:MAG TPA: hypothetical protein VJ779_16485 [Acetobacteraceae bacterium]|nr:hypothetical protein [Acetobacteraceae bacterium]